MAKRKTPQDKKPAVHSSMDDAEYDDDEGPNPVPDEDGNVVLWRRAGKKPTTKERANGRRPNHGTR
jgi:hypothetical protein